MEKAMRLTLVALAAVLAAGCAGQPATTSQPKINLSGYPPEFKQGYTDGCASAGLFAARRRDEGRFKTDTNYAQGWRDGYDICRKR